LGLPPLCGAGDDLLAPKAETLNQLAVPTDVGLGQVVQESTTPTNEQQKTTTTVMVVLVVLQVLSEVGDPTGEKCHLDLGRTRVSRRGGVLIDDLLLRCGVKRHCEVLL
jgi:hypothetical protein